MTSSPSVFIINLLVILCFINSISCGQHSAKWNNYIRTKRQDPNQPWQNRLFTPVCTLNDLTRYDALGRRDSRILLTPESQGNCGSCWAFGMNHAFADQLNINANFSNVAAFSQDHTTKCYGGELGNGCCGIRDLAPALEFLKTTGTVPATCWPYTLKNYPPAILLNIKLLNFVYKLFFPLRCPKACVDNSILSTQRLAGYKTINSEDQVMAAVDRGPVIASVYLTETETSLRKYRCGVYTNSDVIPGKRNHIIEIVDYSSPSFSGPAFWVAKNSWGLNWGEEGYFRIARGMNLLADFISLHVDGSSTVAPTSNPSSIPVNACSAQTLSNVNQNILVESAAEFGLEVLTSQSLITCSAGNEVPILQLVSIINATLQVIEGFILNVTVQATVVGCSSTTGSAVVRLAILQEMDDSFSLLSYSYTVTKGGAVTKTCCSALLLMLLICALLAM